MLTSDSDLLVFSGPTDWGVIMLQDLTFTPLGATARVFRPTAMAASLKFPLIEVAYQTSLDPYASLSQTLERLGRVEERRRFGVGLTAIPDGFVNEYMLPPAAEGGRMVKEPRIGELLFLATAGEKAGKMYFPFLKEDPQRATAWEVGGEVRAVAYTLLFTKGQVKEVFRRGTRIVESVVPCVVDTQVRLAELAARIKTFPDTWWAGVVLDWICGVSRSPLSCAELTAAASALLPNPAPSRGAKQMQRWTWERVHLFAMVQAGWYSLLLLREVLVFLDQEENVEMREGLKSLPDVLDLFDGPEFLAGFEDAGPAAMEVGREALEKYQAELEENDNGKRVSGDEEWSTVESKKSNKKRNADTGVKVVDSGNRFAALLADM